MSLVASRLQFEQDRDSAPVSVQLEGEATASGVLPDASSTLFRETSAASSLATITSSSAVAVAAVPATAPSAGATSAVPFPRERGIFDIRTSQRTYHLYDPLGAASAWRDAILAARAEINADG
jgi:hypothetical protein